MCFVVRAIQWILGRTLTRSLENPTKDYKIPNAVKEDSKTISDPTQICNKINEHFVTVGKKLSCNMTAPKNKNFLKYLGKRQVSSVVLQPTDAFEVIETIAGFKDSKSPGCIDILVTLIK